MQVSSYLATSRHGLYYFRFPIPQSLHPQGKASDIKLSLKTRCPREALHLSRALGYTTLSNGVTFTDLDRLNDPQLRKFILDQGKEISGSMAKVRTSSADQGFAQILKDSGFHDKTALESDHLLAVNVAQKSGSIQIT